jgi:HlyD family secretion protein
MTLQLASLRIQSLAAPEGSTGSMASLRRHAAVGVLVMAVLVLGLGGWTATTEIAGAIVGNGVVVVEGGSKRVQHSDGGIVREILVKNDDRVAAGQLLVRLDDVAIRSGLDVVMSQLRDAIGAEARLAAESTDTAAMALPAIVKNWPTDPELSSVMSDQEKLRRSRKKSLDSQAARLDEQIVQRQAAIVGLKAQLVANNTQLDLAKAENTNLDKLFGQGLISIQRLNQVKQNQANLEGQVGSVTASIASAESSISELQMQRAQIYVDFHSQVLTDLQAASQSVAELLQKKIAAEDKLAHLSITAPISGTVHESTVQTVGGVVAAGETLMLIVPADDHLLLDARVSPLDVDKLHIGQEADVRLSGFDSRTTPSLKGKIAAISPDLIRDTVTGVQYYSVRVNVPDSERARLPKGTKLVPGMPAETFFETGDRTVLAYLMKPLEEALGHTFREQ